MPLNRHNVTSVIAPSSGFCTCSQLRIIVGMPQCLNDPLYWNAPNLLVAMHQSQSSNCIVAMHHFWLECPSDMKCKWRVYVHVWKKISCIIHILTASEVSAQLNNDGVTGCWNHCVPSHLHTVIVNKYTVIVNKLLSNNLTTCIRFISICSMKQWQDYRLFTMHIKHAMIGFKST